MLELLAAVVWPPDAIALVDGICCRHCGARFEPTHRSSRYCSRECFLAGHKRRNRAYEERRRAAF